MGFPFSRVLPAGAAVRLSSSLLLVDPEAVWCAPSFGAVGGGGPAPLHGPTWTHCHLPACALGRGCRRSRSRCGGAAAPSVAAGNPLSPRLAECGFPLRPEPVTCWDFVSASVVPVPSGNFSAPSVSLRIPSSRIPVMRPLFPPVRCPPWSSDFFPGPCSVLQLVQSALYLQPCCIVFYPQMFTLFRNLSCAFSL